MREGLCSLFMGHHRVVHIETPSEIDWVALFHAISKGTDQMDLVLVLDRHLKNWLLMFINGPKAVEKNGNLRTPFVAVASFSTAFFKALSILLGPAGGKPMSSRSLFRFRFLSCELAI